MKLHLPNIKAHIPKGFKFASIPFQQKRMDRAAGLGKMNIKNPNPFSHMSASIEASHKRKLARSPKPRRR
jgi:hypothetical protein